MSDVETSKAELTQDAVERVARALQSSFHNWDGRYLGARIPDDMAELLAKTAIAAMALRSAGLSDAKLQEEAETPPYDISPEEYAKMKRGGATPTRHLIDELRICLHQAIAQCEVHNSEYHHETSAKLIAHWKDVHERASLARFVPIKEAAFNVLPEKCPKCGDRLISNARSIECGALDCAYVKTTK
jgi:hypothetical protein